MRERQYRRCCTRLAATLLPALSLITVGAAATVTAATGPADIFKTRCSGCHTFGQGIRVGPDLKGVTERRTRQWLLAWIRSSDKLIEAGDATAQSLFREFRQLRMPPQEFSDAEISALLDYLAAGGPEREQAKRIRHAAEATVDDIRLGEKLFFGRAPLASGALACAACHSLSVNRSEGGTLASDLSEAYARYRDVALDGRLKRMCIPAKPDAVRLRDQESLALRAYLRSVSTPVRMAPKASDAKAVPTVGTRDK